jgi:hypothetical protein
MAGLFVPRSKASPSDPPPGSGILLADDKAVRQHGLHADKRSASIASAIFLRWRAPNAQVYMEFNDNLKYGVSQVCFATTFCDKSHDADDASPLRAGTLQRIKGEFDYITARKTISEP